MEVLAWWESGIGNREAFVFRAEPEGSCDALVTLAHDASGMTQQTPVSDHRSLKVWQKAMQLAQLIYVTTRSFPTEERFGLTAQLRRAAVSVPANIAEGNGRIYRREYVYHLSVARGSLREVSTMLELAKRLDYVAASDLKTAEDLIDHTGRMLTLLIKSLQRKPVSLKRS